MRIFQHRVQTQGGPAVTVVLGNPTIDSIAEFFDVEPEDVQIIEDETDGEEYVIVAGRGMGVIGEGRCP